MELVGVGICGCCIGGSSGGCRRGRCGCELKKAGEGCLGDIESIVAIGTGGGSVAAVSTFSGDGSIDECVAVRGDARDVNRGDSVVGALMSRRGCRRCGYG